ncbi:MAG: glycosyltransferase, partial [Bacteroidales bacterium]|nr:glycosyltransferase [Bacteroidales bacterium]
MNHPRRILIIPSWYPPDGGYFFKEHSEAIRKMGWKVDVLVNRVVGVRKMIQTGPSALKGYTVHKENGLRVIRSSYLKIPGSEKHNIGRWAKETRRNYQKYESLFGRPDLILTHSVTWAGYAAALIKEKFDIPYLVVDHRSFFVWSTKKAREMVKPYYLPFFEKAYRNCSKLVLVSESLLTGLKALMPWIDNKTMVIPNMIREDMFLPPDEPRRTEPFVFVWAGRLEHVKGLDLLLEAVRELKGRALPHFSVRLAGKGSLRSELEQMAGELGVKDQVHFLGRLSREDMQKEMQKANCFVLPTRYEAFGAVLIEAMATGLPVIATRSGGPDTIVTEESGLLIDSDNYSQLAEAMEQMILDHKRFSAGQIRAMTIERYGQTGVMKRYNH